MDKNKNFKSKIIKIYQDLNNIDVNELLSKLKEIKLEDLNKFELKDLFFIIKNSKSTKYVLSTFIFIFLIFLIINPSIKNLQSKFKLSSKFIKEKKELPSLKNELLNIKNKYKVITTSVEEFKKSIILKDELIFLSNLLDELSKNTSVRIDLLSPIKNNLENSTCKISEYDRGSNDLKNKRRKNRKIKNKKINNIQEEIYQLNIYGDYLNVIKFLNYIQNYNLTIIVDCLQVVEEKVNEEESGNVNANLILRLPIRKN